MFTLTLVTPEKKLVAGSEIEEVFVPAFRGELNILPGHAPLMTTLRPGVLKYRLKGESAVHTAAISWGYCQVTPFGVNVMAETAERPEEIDVERVSDSLQDAETHLMNDILDEENYDKYESQMARALARQQLVSTATSTATTSTH